MKIVKAMKELSRISGEINELKHRMQKCLNCIEGNEFPESFRVLLSLYHSKINRMISLKKAIMIANIQGNMFEEIIKLGELKHYLTFVKELDPKYGKQESRYGESETYRSQIFVKDKTTAIQEIQDEINRITDVLDDFNAVTNIGEMKEIALHLPKISEDYFDNPN